VNGTPTEIKIGAVDYTVVVESGVSDEFGSCDTVTQTIILSANQTAQAVSDTLLHEVLHAIWTESGLFMIKRPDEETIVRTTSTWLRMVLRDNPHVAAFIFDATGLWPHRPTITGEKRIRHVK
jgi:hypothetical protein